MSYCELTGEVTCCGNYLTSLHHRPSHLAHDHCYSSAIRPSQSTEQANDVDPQGEQPMDVDSQGVSEEGKNEEEKRQVKDPRRCVLCPVEGDAKCNVSG